MVVDPRFTDGVWYDMSAGDYCRIEQKRQGAALVTPDGEDEYYEWEDDATASLKLQDDFRKIPTEAVENPADFVVDILDLAQRGGSPTVKEQMALGYAREQVEIQESE